MSYRFCLEASEEEREREQRFAARFAPSASAFLRLNVESARHEAGEEIPYGFVLARSTELSMCPRILGGTGVLPVSITFPSSDLRIVRYSLNDGNVEKFTAKVNPRQGVVPYSSRTIEARRFRQEGTLIF
jgi:hypothetical protein